MERFLRIKLDIKLEFSILVKCLCFLLLLGVFYFSINPVLQAVEIEQNVKEECFESQTRCEQISNWIANKKAQSQQVVNFFAWGGDPNINAYLQWVAGELYQQYGITFNHIKIASTTEAVTLITAEGVKPNSKPSGSVDLIWINGKNFSLLQGANLLQGGWVSQLPNYQWLNSRNRPYLLKDFGLDTQGYEMPWGQANLVFFYNAKHINNDDLPDTPDSLLAFSKKYKGRFAYPRPTDFVGVSFLKQTLSQLKPLENGFHEPVNPDTFETLTKPLWDYLGQLHPYLYQEGQYFANSNTALLRLFDDELILLGVTFSPNSILGSKLRFDLPSSVGLHAMKSGSLSNVHFLAIPAFAANPDAAQITANFLLSPKAQAKKADINGWGDQTVLDVNFFNTEIGQLFNNNPASILTVDKHLEEFHPSWDSALIDAWQIRFGQHSFVDTPKDE
ncbi:ABC transporter substrate-binding protein [Thorsellia anophelis]|uniref:Putative thiamine transport system substrate-binding protein n=1 Tax=Thorsellia anophelis DSM 18579 TaxID=1123402 RepID=A0A1I0C9L4_9GAMM|nr:ABC transporter substrate-binding protein [Thorsellia anophelis]SET15552.1 putative thiamine transport system substrate-binding protein [Thorsellia anophelis DSM 18579]